MSFTAAVKAEIIQKHQQSKTDTGSSEVQIALLSARIEYLTQHMKANKHDVHTRYGLTRMVSQRRRLLNYLKRYDPTSYQKLITELDLRG